MVCAENLLGVGKFSATGGSRCWLDSLGVLQYNGYGSGGGSINIFTLEECTKTNFTCSARGGLLYNGGRYGGNGTVSFTKLLNDNVFK